MPTSKKRRRSLHPARPTARVDPRTSIPPGFPAERVPELVDLMLADAAEMAGDPAEALRVMARRPSTREGGAFWRPWRITYLEQLLELDPLPGWVVSRWLLAQAAQSLRHRGARRALDLVIELQGGVDRLPGTDAAEAQVRVIDHDWVFRQLLLYELGALTTFLRESVSPALKHRADRVDEWVAAPMGAYVLRGRTPGTLRWEDVATGDRVEVPNTGCALLVATGEHAIGRLVPAGDGRMFESAPLVVPASVATAVSLDPAGWFDVLRSERDATGACAVETSRMVTTLLTDVPTSVWMALLTPVAGGRARIPLSPEEIVALVVDEVQAEMRRSFPPRPDEVELWPLVAAALLEPGVGRALAERAGSDADVIAHLAEVLAEPAKGVCRRALTSSTDAA